MPKKKKEPVYNFVNPPHYEVHWMDAQGNSKWHSPEEAVEWIEAYDTPIIQAGYVLRNDEDCIVMVSRYQRDEDGDIFSVGGIIRIPKPWIINIFEIKEA